MRNQHGNKYADLTQAPRFAFGHGLSYTRFEYANLAVQRPRLSAGQALEVSVELSNIGHREGTEIVQVYLSDLVTSVTWVDKSLVAFARVTLAAGETRLVTFEIPQQRLALIDAYERSVVEPGEFEILVGPSSANVDLLKASFVVEGESFSFGGIPGVARPARPT